MTIKIVKALAATVALVALTLGTAPSMARSGGGGGGGHGGGGHGGGGGHFSAAHVGGGSARVGGTARVSGGRIGTSRVGAANIRSGNVRSFSSTRTGTSRSNFARWVTVSELTKIPAQTCSISASIERTLGEARMRVSRNLNDSCGRKIGVPSRVTD